MGHHTKGPWQCYADLPSTEPNWHIVTSDNRQRVIANVHIEPGNASDEANARLITASPDLLEALIAALPYVEDIPTQGYKAGAVAKITRQIRAAIDKAGAR